MGRNCGDCTLAERGLCPSAVVNKKTEMKRIKKEIIKVEKRVKMEETNVLIKEEEAAPKT